MSMSETHTFQVSLWMPGNENPKSIFEKGRWSEYARCRAKYQAEEVGLALSLRWTAGVQVAELEGNEETGARFVGYKFYPESARDLR